MNKKEKILLAISLCGIVIVSVLLSGCVGNGDNGTGNKSPTVNAGINQSVIAGDTVSFTGIASDSDGNITYYEWDFDGNGVYDWSSTTTCSTTHVYNNAGTYTAKLRVTDNEGATSIDTITITVSEAPIEPIILQGSGDTVTNTFILNEGLAIFHMSHSGHSNFAIWLYEALTGERVDLLVNEIGSYEGSTIVGVTGGILQASPGSHLLDITADGNWQVIIEQPRPTTAPKLPQTFTGGGDSVPSPFTLETGTVKFEMSHDGNSNFAIWLYDKDGDRVDLLVNEIGSYEGSTIVGVTGGFLQASPGIHYIDITADGDWDVTITQL